MKNFKMSLVTSAVLFSIASTGQLFADVVTIKSPDGSTSFTGRLIEFDGSNYTVETTSGSFTAPAASVICEGEACFAKNVEDVSSVILGNNSDS